MAKGWKIRHSPVGWAVRKTIHLLFRARHSATAPVTYRLPGSVEIRLFPEGEIAGFCAFPNLFEHSELELVARYLKPGMNMVDVGANIGLYSILGSSLVGDSGRVWAFEPSRESYQRLLRNLQLNACTRVQPFQLALSDEVDQWLRLTSDAGYGDAYRYLAPAVAAGTKAKGELVWGTTLDACAKQHGICDVDLIKIDVEGGEYRVLLGAKEVLAANPNVTIVFESEADWCERAGCRQQDAFALLRGAGFDLYAWDKANKAWACDEETLLRTAMVWASRIGPPQPAQRQTTLLKKAGNGTWNM